MALPDGVLLGALTVVFTLWLLASIPNQFRWEWWERIARRDVLGLLPRWTFFAPRPGRHDLHILIRDWSAGSPGQWRELERRPPTPWRRAFWNPDRFVRKTVTDTGNALVRAASRPEAGSPTSIQLHSAYIEILGWVMAAPPPVQDTSPGDARQFILVRTQTDRPGRRLDVTFISFEHPRL
ncbi:MAG: hypothetical protein ABWX92_04860 [Mycetocola sp.]